MMSCLTLEVINKSSVQEISHFHLMWHLFEYSHFIYSHGKRGVIFMMSCLTLEVINKSSVREISHFHLMCHLFEYSHLSPLNANLCPF